MVEADTSFTDEPEPGRTTEERIKPRNVGIIILTSLFAPIAISIFGEPGWGYHFSMLSLLFVINYNPSEGFYIYPTLYPWGHFDYFYLMNMLMALGFLAGPRLALSYQAVRLYKGRTTKKRALILGFVADCYFLFLMIPTLIFSLISPYAFFSLILPIPMAFFLFLVLLKFRPPPVVITPWKDVEEPDKWWEEKKATPTTQVSTSTQSEDVQGAEKGTSKAKSGYWWDEEESEKKSKDEETSPW